jgi:hypothetical protein
MRRILTLAAMLVLAGCDGLSIFGSGLGTAMVLENRTDAPVAVHADGAWIGTYPAMTDQTVRIPGDLPIEVSLVGARDVALLRWTLGPEQAETGGSAVFEGPCGIVRVSAGRIELPALPAVPATGPCT